MAITNTSTNQAGSYATGIIAQLNQMAGAAAAANNKLLNGLAAIATTGVPAVTADEIKSALGTTCTAKVLLLNAVFASSDDAKLAAALAALA